MEHFPIVFNVVIQCNRIVAFVQQCNYFNTGLWRIIFWCPDFGYLLDCKQLGNCFLNKTTEVFFFWKFLLEISWAEVNSPYFYVSVLDVRTLENVGRGEAHHCSLLLLVTSHYMVSSHGKQQQRHQTQSLYPFPGGVRNRIII